MSEDRVHRRKAPLSLALLSCVTFGLSAITGSASAETMAQALSAAYGFNPQINAARAQTRSDDENVPLAKSGLRPIISAFGELSATRSTVGNVAGDRFTSGGSVGVTLSQNLFSGFRVRNQIRQSEAGVLASRDLLRNTVQNVLFDAAQAYMDVIRDSAILEIRRNNVIFLQEQVRAAGERFNVGETTRTDVSQTRARFATARANVSLAEANLATSRAVYRQIIGHDARALSDGFPYARLVPQQLASALSYSQDHHPIILASIHQADAQSFLVKQIEGELLPSVSLEGTVEHDEAFNSGPTYTDPTTATIGARVSVPIYQGGAVSARVRQAKEQYGLRKVEIDLSRDQVRAAVVTAWAQVAAARGAIQAANEGVGAADIALSGVQEEQRVGQRTTLDVLNQQQELLSARETLVIAQRDIVVASFALLSAMGRLDATQLRLAAVSYDPVPHYDAVKDKWYGVRTPDGR